jgi:flagellar basal-body rod protein FlgB
MIINFDSAFGIHETALSVRSHRSEVLAANLANADTPNYKARDIDFRSELSRATQETHASQPRSTHARHLVAATDGGYAHLYRVPVQPSLDGNTVDGDIEQASFMDNALRYQASLQFLSGRIKGLLTAIRGD